MFGINTICFLYFLMGICSAYIIIRIYDAICDYIANKEEEADEQIKIANRNKLFK